MSAIICQVLTMPKLHSCHCRSLVLALNRDSEHCRGRGRRIRWCHWHLGSVSLPNADKKVARHGCTNRCSSNTTSKKGSAENAANMCIFHADRSTPKSQVCTETGGQHKQSDSKLHEIAAIHVLQSMQGKKILSLC